MASEGFRPRVAATRAEAACSRRRRAPSSPRDVSSRAGARATFETEARRSRRDRVTFRGALLRLGVLSLLVALMLELGADLMRRAQRGVRSYLAPADDDGRRRRW